MPKIDYLKNKLIKRADSGTGDGNDSSFEQAMSDLADIVLRDRAPALKQYELGFQLLDRDEDNEKAVGVKVFKVNKSWLFAPVFFLKGRIKGTELLYIKNQDIFVPMQEDWIRYILNKQTNPVGSSVTRNLGQLGVSMPDLRQLIRPPTKFASVLANEWKQAKEMLYKEVLPSWAKSLTSDPLKKVALSLPAFIKDAGKPAVDALWRMVKEFPKLADDLERYHGKDIHEAIRVGAVKKAAELPKRPRIFEDLLDYNDPIKMGYLAVNTYDKALKDDSDELTDFRNEKEPDLREGPLIKDTRTGEQVSVPYSLNALRDIMNPDRTGIYEVLVQPNKYEKCLVIIGAKTANARMVAAVVVRLSDKVYINAHPSKVWCGRYYEDPEWSDWFKGLSDASSMDSSGEEYSFQDDDDKYDIFIGPNGDATAPVRAFSVVGDADGGTAYRVRFDTERPCRTPDFDGASRSLTYEHPHLTYDHCTVLNLGTSRGSKIWSTEGNMYIPDGFKKLTVKCPEESGFQLTSPWHVTLDVVKKTTGLKVGYVHDRVMVNDQPFTKDAALIHLVVDHGLRETEARAMLKLAADQRYQRDPFIVGRVKYADPYLTDRQPGAPGIPEPFMSQEPTLTGSVPAIPEQYIQQPVTDMRPHPDNAAAYDLRMPPHDAMQAVQQAAQTGQKEVFDTSMISGLLQTTQGDLQIDKYLGALMSGLDAKGRILMNFYWHGDDFGERYGKDDLVSLEDMLRNTFINDGKLILNLKQKGVEDPLDTQRDLELESASDQ